MADVFTKPLEPLQFINLVNKINSPPPKISINHIFGQIHSPDCIATGGRSNAEQFGRTAPTAR